MDDADAKVGSPSDNRTTHLKIRYRLIIASLPRERTIIQYLIRKGLIRRLLEEGK